MTEMKATEEMDIEPLPLIVPKVENKRPTSQKQLYHLARARERKKELQEKKIIKEYDMMDGVTEVKNTVAEIAEDIKDLKRKHEETMEYQDTLVQNITEVTPQVNGPNTTGRPPVEPSLRTSDEKPAKKPKNSTTTTREKDSPNYISFNRGGLMLLGVGFLSAAIAALYVGPPGPNNKQRSLDAEGYIPF
jgi:hypothetical protein